MEEGATFIDNKKTKVSCKRCGTAIITSSLRHHVDLSHGIVMPQTWGVDVSGGGLETYVVSFPRVLNSVTCPVDGCP